MKQSLEKLRKYCTKCTASCTGCIFVVSGECFFNDAPGDWDIDVLMELLGKISETAESCQLPTTNVKTTASTTAQKEICPKCGSLLKLHSYNLVRCSGCNSKFDRANFF